ncbi:MAG: hypothetical protein HZB85_05145 [Deltaproteobacteria bacterium]|nr:hypothetical protein [Deltaproteobacteria bacterium]
MREPLAEIEGVKRVKTVLRSEELILSAVSEVLRKAAWVERERTGIVLGADNAIDECKEEYYRGVLAEGPLGASPLSFPYTSANAITAQTTIAFGLHHETFTVTDGPLSFLKAAGLAFDLIQTGICRAVIAGGFSQKAAFAMLMQDAGAPKGARHRTIRITDTQAAAGDAASTASIEETFGSIYAMINGKDGSIKGVDKWGGNMVFVEIGSLPD